MSASPIARQVTETKTIPTKKVYLNDDSELPAHYSSTPGGTLYSTTPGGTKIVYEKAFLLNLRNSPISKTPPKCNIPDSMLRNTANNTNQRIIKNNTPKKPQKSQKTGNTNEEDDQFHIDL